MGYPVIFNGDHAEFEAEHANTPPKDRSDWPLPSFDAIDWAEAFCKIANEHGFKNAKGEPVDEGWMVTWFAAALMRGYDEHAAARPDVFTEKVRWGVKGKRQLPLFMVWREYRCNGEVEGASVLFNSTDWIGA